MHDFFGHKAFNDYYENLKNIQQQSAVHEQATRLAFHTLLNDLGKSAVWTLGIEDPLPNKKRPDGTLKDTMTIPRGYWEAKDTKDDLDREIKNKTFLEYPLVNTIFEDTRRAVLFQNGRQSGEFDLTQPGQLATLLNKFFNHITEDVEAFHEAVSLFRERIPVLIGKVL